jgi:hypothetical protein
MSSSLVSDRYSEVAIRGESMKRSRWILAAVIVALVAVAGFFTVVKRGAARSRSPGAGAGAGAGSHTAVSGGEVGDTVPELDRAALAELERMGAYLRTLKSFQLKADVTTEDVRTDGQKVQTLRAVDLVARRPNRLYAEITNDRQRRLLFYDGAQFTIFAPRTTFFATVAAPPTIEGLADVLEDKYDIELPLVDLFRWGTPEGNVDALTSAVDLGPSAINGVTCEQYAFRQEGVDWQLWIQRGDAPLPCRIVITTLTDDARPQHSATYTWNLAPSFDDETFVFRAPADAKRIPLAEVSGVAPSPSPKAERH